jgi:hypothetical protein
MRFILLLTFFISSITLNAQTVFTSVLQGFTPAPLYEVDGYLYVGTFANSSEPAQIFRVPIDNPANLELVSDFSGPSIGVWKMTYYPAQNSLLVYNFIGLFKVDLNQSLPISQEQILDQLAFCLNGITQKNGVVYLGCLNEIATIDTNASNPMLESFFNLSANEEAFNPIINGDELYFSVINNGDYDLYKLNINDPTGSFELVSTLDENTGGIQSSLIAENFLYLGVEGTPHRILKLDLSNLNLPIEEDVLIDNFSGAPIGLARSGNRIFITDGNTQNIWEFTDTTLASNDIGLTSFQISPNPATDYLFLTNILSDATFMIYSIHGQVLIQGNYTDAGIDLSGLHSGMYFISVEVDERLHTKKFIKK